MSKYPFTRAMMARRDPLSGTSPPHRNVFLCMASRGVTEGFEPPTPGSQPGALTRLSYDHRVLSVQSLDK